MAAAYASATGIAAVSRIDVLGRTGKNEEIPSLRLSTSFKAQKAQVEPKALFRSSKPSRGRLSANAIAEDSPWPPPWAVTIAQQFGISPLVPPAVHQNSERNPPIWGGGET